MTSMRKSRLSYARQNRLIDHFATGAAGLREVKQITAIYFFFRRPHRIAALETVPDVRDLFSGEAEMGEGCFGGHRSLSPRRSSP